MPHYYSEKQEGRMKPFPVRIRLKEREFELFSAAGVFSKKELDTGTRLLIENCEVKDRQSVLDLGCGYGAIGISIAMQKNVDVLMADINERAVRLAKMNIKKHGLQNIRAQKSDLYSDIKEKFDVILSNPPQTAGKKVCFDIIEGAFAHLNDGGTLQIVARHQKGGKELEKKIRDVFSNVSTLAKGSGFRVYMGKKGAIMKSSATSLTKTLNFV